ncbi:MAG: EF-P beta-lysylation protein EpmB [Rubripirellula sp.]
MRNGSTNQSDEILAANSDFVPTAFSGPHQESDLPPVDWQTAMKRAIRSPRELRQILGLEDPLPIPPGTERSEPPKYEQDFGTFVPLEFLSLMRHGDPADPLLRQVLSVPAEGQSASGFTADPVGDLQALASHGVLHKYHGRALVLTTGACGVHCRYCFRREFPYQSTSSRSDDWRPSLDYLRENEDVEEVILSGGDPLTTTDGKLSELLTSIEAIDHVRRLRIHSRMPVVIPQRVTPELIERLAKSRLAVWMVIHANHPRELSANVLAGLGRLVDAGIPVLNQAVLLRGVNDEANALIELCRTLVNHRVQPYYLHQLDRVQGAAHFEVSVERGQQLISKLRDVLPGYAVPQYVVEEAGSPSKTPIRP